MSPRIQVCRYTHCVLLKGRIAVDSRILGEPETHTSHPELLPATPTNIQTQHNSWFYFPLLASIKGIYEQQGMWEFIQNGTRHAVAMRKGVGEGRTGSWGYSKMIKKKKSPTVERKELYSVSSDKPHEKEYTFLNDCIVFMCITESHCCAEELKATLKISHTSMKFLEKNKSVHSSHFLFLSFWLLLLVFCAENAGSPPAIPQSILYLKTLFCIGA